MRNTSDLGNRIVYGFPAAVLAIFMVVSGDWWFAAGAIGLGLICMHELFAMFDDVRPARIVGFLGLIALGVAAIEGEPFHLVLVGVCVIPVLFGVTILGPSAQGGTFGMAIVLLGVFWIGMGIAHAIMLRELPHGGGIVAAVLIGTFVGDTGAYFVGRAIGRTKLAPQISPNKTIEGLAGGLLTAIIAVWVVNLYQDWIDAPDALILGVAVALMAPLGDLFESFIKRDAGTKDTGKLFGAHGGALDRLDAVLFTLVAGYYVWNAIGV
ncbi:MAG: Phosphatidate cytidylyltransferase [uncultured Solirubrobacteraceae bacterium]|uniref:Phosphatidate cytidylyltransferase n=1 Tax=uncultured Solirubrobacteraceae bacterium TaxID=1162706 RepID=A0A6J4SEH5_9ACTN|nr:MAG: Phosphatidate cytidylyltransferase [uncultured Solirubrobacteraceae bacterium]